MIKTKEKRLRELDKIIKKYSKRENGLYPPFFMIFSDTRTMDTMRNN